MLQAVKNVLKQGDFCSSFSVIIIRNMVFNFSIVWDFNFTNQRSDIWSAHKIDTQDTDKNQNIRQSRF